MFYVKGDDMDDMFRKAAEDYELNEDLAADWNSVQSALQHDEAAIIHQPEEKKRKRYIWFWLFLLIPAALFTTYEAGVFKGTTANKHVALNNKNEQQQSSTSTGANVENQNQKKNTNPGLNSNKNDYSLKDDVTKNNESNKNYFNQQTTTKKNQQFNSKELSLNNVNDNIAQQHQLNNLNPVAVNGNGINNNVLNDNNASQSTSIQQTNNTNDVVLNNNKKIIQDSVTSSNKNDSISKNTITSVTKNDSATTTVKAKQKQTTKNKIARQSFVYAGLSGLADISFVKNQKTSKIGLGGGILAGYHFKNGLSIESGVLLDRKNYYSNGKYFNKDKLSSFLQSSTIIYANGNCNMWEVPVNVKYDFNSKRKYNFFVTTGVSSYFMKKEYYDMKFEKDGMLYQKGYDYYHSANNIFSVLNLGAGINMQAGKKYFVQVQPYYKVPLSGVGTGKLPLSSGGISVSVMRRFK